MRRVRFYLIGVLSLLFLLVHTAHGEECRQWPEQFEPYTGITLSGPRGAPERDPIWFRDVRSVSHRNAATSSLYMLRHASPPHRGALYDSIAPVSLGGTAYGFIATQNGCDVLLDRHGRPLIPDRFGGNEWSAEPSLREAPGISTQADSPGRRRGQGIHVRAISPRPARDSCAALVRTRGRKFAAAARADDRQCGRENGGAAHERSARNHSSSL